MMDFRDYLVLARILSNGSTEAEWRSAASRAYYAPFHAASELLDDLGFSVPISERPHSYLWLRLANSGSADVINAGQDLNDLRRERNRADYDGHLSYTAVTASDVVQSAEEVVRVLDAARNDPVRTSITDTMKVYERDVLRDATWHP